MNNVHEFPQNGRRYDEAGIWIAKMDNELTPTETEELQEWMAADPKNQEVLFKMANLWDEFSIMFRLSHLFPESPKRHQKPSWYPLAIAASMVLVAVLGVYTIGDRSSGADGQGRSLAELDPNVYETAVGEQSTVNLSDGSEIVLNTNSFVKVEYTDDYRLIRLERGEIHVVVSPDKSRPFSVISNHRIVQAVGTAFSLDRTADGYLELIVVEGTVLAASINPHVVNPNDIRSVDAAQKSLTVTGGQEILLGSIAEEIRSVSVEEMEVRLSWREGNLIFRGESLEDALAEIGRYTSVEFEILDDGLKSVQIAGRFRTGDVDGLLAALSANFNVTHRRTRDDRVLLSHL